jgi:hypothetical protein
MDAKKLLTKLEFEAERDWVKNWNKRKLETIQRCQTKPETKAEQSRKKLRRLRARTSEIEEELELRAKVATEQERCFKAEKELRAANLTMVERKAQEAETREFQIRLSRITSAEQHPDWRIHAAAEFNAKKL